MDPSSSNILAVEPGGNPCSDQFKKTEDSCFTTVNLYQEAINNPLLEPSSSLYEGVDDKMNTSEIMVEDNLCRSYMPSHSQELMECASSSSESPSAFSTLPGGIKVQDESSCERVKLLEGKVEMVFQEKNDSDQMMEGITGKPEENIEEEEEEEEKKFAIAERQDDDCSGSQGIQDSNHFNSGNQAEFSGLPRNKTKICTVPAEIISTTAEVETPLSMIFCDESFIQEESVICDESVISDNSVVREMSGVSGNVSVTKVDVSSEDEEINYYVNSGKSGAESSSSKDESPSVPSCSGTSRTGLNSLSSDSEDDLPPINLILPLKKRKRETLVEVISSSSCSEDDTTSEIDYANLTPEEIKALIEEAKRYGNIKRRCKCPKKKWSDLPIKGPTEPSGKCLIGKGDWSERSSVSCAACAADCCTESNHKHARRSRRKVIQPRSLLSKTRARGTIGQDVPIIDLSDTEETSQVPNSVASDVTITAIPPVPAGECIVLSSSDDDDDIVCEGVIKTEPKTQAMGPEALNLTVLPKEVSPDVVVLNATSTQTQSRPALLTPTAPQVSTLSEHTTPSAPDATMGRPSLFPPLAPHVPILPPQPVPPVPDPELFPDFDFDLDNWDEQLTMNLLYANIIGPPREVPRGPPDSATATPADRPSSPEGWSCPICLESKTAVNEIMSTTCGHIFCGDCIRSAVKIHKKCPTCRKKLTLKQFHKIFL